MSLPTTPPTQPVPAPSTPEPSRVMPSIASPPSPAAGPLPALEIPVRHCGREVRPTTRYGEDYVRTDEQGDTGDFNDIFSDTVENMALLPGKLATFRQAMISPEAAQWTKAMEYEIEQLRRNGTWELVNLPPDRKAVKS